MSGRIISARFNEASLWELEFLKETLGDKTITDILSTAVHYLYQKQCQKKKKQTAFEFLQESGFVGGTEGSKNDSVDYKKIVTERIKKKL